jgi:hypothetical protein
MIPLRGDPGSRLVISLALFLHSAFWATILWAPILATVGSIQEAPDVPADEAVGFWIGFAIGLVVGVGILTFILYRLSRAVMGGSRVAYLLAGVCLALYSLGSVLVAVANNDNFFISWLMRAILFMAIGVIFFVMGCRPGFSSTLNQGPRDGESDSRLA